MAVAGIASMSLRLGRPGSARPALAQVEGRLTLRADRGFTLLNLTKIKAERGAATLTRLQESATGTCREQR